MPLRNEDEIKITGLEIYAYHGVYEEEARNGQLFIIDATLETDTREAGRADDLSLSTNYGEVARFIDSYLKENRFQLLEAAVENCAEQILLHFPRVHAVTLEMKKPKAPIPLPFKDVSVKIRRARHRAYIAVGSNMGDKKATIEQAQKSLENDPKIRVCKSSQLFLTKPYGGVEQDTFLNGAIAIDTLYTPHELLRVLQQTEADAGRERTIHWGPRTLDLDIIFYDDLVLLDQDLVIPHSDMQNRLFVLEPLVQLCPAFVHPLLNQSVYELWTALKEKGEFANGGDLEE